MFKRTAVAVAVASIVASGVGGAVASAAGGPPSPKTFGGATVSLFATGMKNPTSFAFGDGAVFAGDSGNAKKVPNGGVYVLKGGKATEIPNSPIFVGGMEFHKGVLYLSAASLGSAGPQFQILAWSGWNGTTFATRKAIYTAPPKFQGFNGIAFGPDGRLYVGVDAGLLDGNDHGPASLSPDLYDILSMNTSGKALKVFATGIRQPWQIAFAPGSSTPFVSDLGQDSAAVNPPDFLLQVHKGDNYGFPNCNWTTGSKCSKYAKPFKMFSPHSDIMGVAVVGTTLYFGSWMGPGAKGGGALYSIPVKGGKVSNIVTGFPLATDALAANGGYLYVGGQTQAGAGVVYRVKP
jgi:glucose/arabinose dehydrogenase